MSELSKSVRESRKRKAASYARTDPHQKVDASGYTPPDALDNEVKVGLRPISRRQYKSGGKVHGEHANHHAGRKPRKGGGKALTADSFLNRDVKEANESRDGMKHIGGMKRGGKAKHDDVAEDKKLIKSMVKPKAIRPGKADGGKSAPSESFLNDYQAAFGKSYYDDNPNAPGAPKKAAKPAPKPAPAPSPAPAGSSGFTGPQYKKGGKVHPKDCKCSKCSGGSVSDGELEGTRPTGGRRARKAGGRAKTNINIVIAPHAKEHPPVGLPPPGMVPPGGPAGMHQGMAPKPAMPPPPMPAAPPGGTPPMGAPAGLMPRKAGGRVKYPLKHASGGGLGRLEKKKAYGHKPAC